jgi:hypothetical protein
MKQDASRTASDISPERPGRTGLVRSGGLRTVAATALLVAITAGWAAYPLSTGRAGTRIAVIVAVVSAVASIGRLVLTTIPRQSIMLPGRSAELLVSPFSSVPWAEVFVVAALVLEALHRAQPWHTGILGIALLGYLFAVHLAETGARPAVLRPQLPAIAAGIGLLALAVGTASLPGTTTGTGVAALRIAAIVAAVLAAGLALPVVGSSRQP